MGYTAVAAARHRAQRVTERAKKVENVASADQRYVRDTAVAEGVVREQVRGGQGPILEDSPRQKKKEAQYGKKNGNSEGGNIKCSSIDTVCAAGYTAAADAMLCARCAPEGAKNVGPGWAGLDRGPEDKKCILCPFEEQLLKCGLVVFFGGGPSKPLYILTSFSMTNLQCVSCHVCLKIQMEAIQVYQRPASCFIFGVQLK